MIVVADPAVQRQPIDRFDAELAVGAGDFGRAAHEIGKRHAERRRRRAAAEARSLILDPEDRGDPVADVEAALIFPALVLAIGFEALRPRAVDRKSTRLNSNTNAHLVYRLLLEKK